MTKRGTRSHVRKSLLQAFRSDELRDLYRAMLKDGWVPLVLGSGHVRLTSPTPPDEVVVMSVSAYGGKRVVAKSRAPYRRWKEAQQ